MGERKRIPDILNRIEPYRSLKYLAKLVTQAVLLEESGEWEGLSIEFRSYHADDHYLVIAGKRWETDKEMEARVQRENKKSAQEKKAAERAAKQKEANERKLYEKLKRKYGP